MAKAPMINTRTFVGGADFSGSLNKIELQTKRDEKDVTGFGIDGWKEFLAGLAETDVSGDVFWEAADMSKPDDVIWDGLTSDRALSVFPALNQTAAASASYGDLAYLTKALISTHKVGDKIGDVAGAVLKGKGNWPLARGVGLHPPGTARSVTGSGTATLYQAATSTQYVYANLHVLSVSGTGTPTLTVKVQSDVDNTFASPADLITFTAATALGGESKRTAGPITDTYYRVSYTISGSSPSFLFVVTVGVA
jgi:hypothetical protein